MYGSVSITQYKEQPMNQDDIQYVLDLINDAIINKDWDIIIDAKDALLEFLDDENNITDIE